MRSVENKEMELERKIQETDKVLREVQSLKVKYPIVKYLGTIIIPENNILEYDGECGQQD